MGLGNAFKRVYRLQAVNLLKLAKWLFWAVVFFGVGLLAGLHHRATPDEVKLYRDWMFYGFGVLALVGFLIRLWEWRLSKPVSEEQ